VVSSFLAGTGWGVACLIGGANPARQEKTLRSKKPVVVVGTPGRLAEMALSDGAQQPRDRGEATAQKGRTAQRLAAAV